MIVRGGRQKKTHGPKIIIIKEDRGAGGQTCRQATEGRKGREGRGTRIEMLVCDHGHHVRMITVFN